MKNRILAILLLLVIALTACTSKQPSAAPHELDIGVTEGNTYKNASLGIACEFPEDWYIYNEDEIASYNGLLASTFDRSAIADAIDSGKVVMFFFAAQAGNTSSVNINANKNRVPDMDEKALLDASIPLVQSEMEQLDGMESVNCALTEVAFCGKTHPAIAVTCEAVTGTLYETILYLRDGDYLYTLTVACGSEDASLEILNLFKPLG